MCTVQVAKEMSVAAVKKELDKAADWCRSRFALQLKKVSGMSSNIMPTNSRFIVIIIIIRFYTGFESS